MPTIKIVPVTFFEFLSKQTSTPIMIRKIEKKP